MKQESLLTNSLKFVAKDLVGSILYWPIWWYTKGFILAAKTLFNQIKEQERRIGLRSWLANLFKPMYGQYDWQGRLISFFMRLVVMIFRVFMLFLWAILIFILLIAWACLPIFAIFQISKFFIWW